MGRRQPAARARSPSTRLREKVVAYLEARDLYVVDAFAGADPAHRLALRVVTESAWHALFAKTLFIEPTEEELAAYEPQALVLHAPAVEADPERGRDAQRDVRRRCTRRAARC